MSTPATPMQVMHLAKLMDSSVWTEAEKNAVATEVADGLSKGRASKLIDRAHAVLKSRRAAEKEVGHAGE